MEEKTLNGKTQKVNLLISLKRVYLEFLLLGASYVLVNLLAL